MSMNVSTCFGLLVLCFQLCEVHGSYVTTDPQGTIETECRDRYFWVSVELGFVGRVPRFEAVVENGVQIINEDHASMCGYTMNNLNSHVSLRASYFSCHTENQNDNNFLFKLNVILTDQEGRENKYSISETCTLPIDWSGKEVICEEKYMEVAVARDTHCTSDKRTSKEAWIAALALAHRSAISEWQIMFLNRDNLDAVSVSDARQMGYMVDSTPNRVVFRSPYNQPHSTITEIDGIAVEVIHTAVFFRQKWAVVMLDTSVACTIEFSSFDEETLHWSTPKVMTPLVQDPFGFVSKNIEMGVEAQRLDEATRKALGYILKEDEHVVHVSVPFGAPGGYRMSLVDNNIYKESYLVVLFYEHIFSHVFTDSMELETRHRHLRVLKTPLVSRIPFTIDETVPVEEVFTVYLGNFASEVQLIAIQLNENYLTVMDFIQQQYYFSKIPHSNGTHGFSIKVPFEDPAVNSVYLGEGVIQYSTEINYTLNIIGQNDTFYHHVFVLAQVNDAFHPDVTAVCTEQSIIFRMNHSRQAGLWELCVGHQALTSDLSRLKGYILQNDSHSVTLEVPLFTSGYIYEDITLRHFFGIFEVLLRDSKTLEAHKRTAKRCLFQTDELTVCSSNGMMTVVATTTKTWPTVTPSSTTLLDRSCRPKSNDETRVMFSFGVTTCGTRLMVGDGYIMYENEIISEADAITDQESSITRESKFRLTVRCFYPLTSVNRVFTSRLFEGPGFGKLTVTTGPQENLISSHTASVFDAKPWSNNMPGESCHVTDKEDTQLLQKGVPHLAYPSKNRGRKTIKQSYHGINIPYHYRHTSQGFQESGMQINPQTAIKHNLIYGPTLTHPRQQYFYDGLFKDYKSSLVDVSKKNAMKQSDQNGSKIQDNSTMIGDENPVSAFYKESKTALSITNESLPSYLQSWFAISNPKNYISNSNDMSVQPYLREPRGHRTPNSGCQHSLGLDNPNELIYSLPPLQEKYGNSNSHNFKASSLYTLVDQTNINPNTPAIANNGNIIPDGLATSISHPSLKQSESNIFPTSNMNHKHQLVTKSSVQPLKLHGLTGTENEGFEHPARNFLHEAKDYSLKKLPKLTQRQKVGKDDHFLFDNKPVSLKPSSHKMRGTVFFPGGGTSRYGPSNHKGIIRG